MRILLASIYPYAFLLLYLIIPFDEYIRAIPNLLLGLLVIAFPFVVQKKDFGKLINKPSLLFLIFFLYLIGNTLLLNRMEEDFTILKKIFIAVLLVVLYIPVHGFKKINKAIIFSALAAILFSLFNFIVLINSQSAFEMLTPENSLDVLLIDRLYLGLLCVLSILVSYKSIRNNFHPVNKYYLINIVVNVLFIFLMISKEAIFIGLAILLVRQLYGPHLKLRLGITAILLAGAILVLSLNNGLPKKFFSSTENQSELNFIEKFMPMEFRQLIWGCIVSMGKDGQHSIFGRGFRNTNDDLLNCYDTTLQDIDTKTWFLSHRFNTHNQFADLYLSAGLLAFLLFIGILASLLFQYRKDYYKVALIVIITLFALSESFFHRQIGGYYFGFILIALLLNDPILNRTTEADEQEIIKE